MTLAMVFAAVYLLRSLPAEGAGGFNPLSPCYILLGFLRGEACLNQVGDLRLQLFFFSHGRTGLLPRLVCSGSHLVRAALLSWPPYRSCVE